MSFIHKIRNFFTLFHSKSHIGRESVSLDERWTKAEKTYYRIAAVYVLFLVFPFTKEAFEYIAGIEWSKLNCRDLFIISTIRHQNYIKLTGESARWGIAGYFNFVIPFALSVPIAWLWGQLERNRPNYYTLDYWIRAIVRYRLGIGLVAWGYRKLLPGQMVLPTLGVLNTPFGDFQPQKLYWQGVGITPDYEVFLGFAEWIAGFLLFFRRTSTPGAALGFVVLLNIVIANHVYEAGVHLHSFFFVLLSLFVLWPDLIKIWKLLYNRTDEQLKRYYPVIKNLWLKYLRLVLKTVTFVVFVVLFFFLQVDDYVNTPYRIPDTPGLSGARGYYRVSEFRLNNEELPYSPLDSVRWQDAIFEDWSTLNFKVNREALTDQSNGGGYSNDDLERGWELAGIGGGRRFFYYTADTVNRILHLVNKNAKHREEKQTLHYSFPAEGRIVLEGINEFNDSIYVVLDRIKQQFQYDREQKLPGKL